MDQQRRRELKRIYQESKPDMGVFAVYCGESVWIGWANDLRVAFNGLIPRLSSGSYVNQALQKLYLAEPDTLRFERLEVLPYDKDESKTDYRADLLALQEMWLEQMPQAQPLKPNERRSKS